jgi:hypothetical protein
MPVTGGGVRIVGGYEIDLHPYWDTLRGDPRFEKIVAGFAPNPWPVRPTGNLPVET